MSTAADLVKGSLRAIGAIASGEAVPASDQADALEVFNDILEEWSNDGFTIYEQVIEEFTLTPSTGAYAIGSGATLDSARPMLIQGAKLKKAGATVETPIDIITNQQWLSLSQRTLSGDPTHLWYNRTAPNGTLNLWPVPSAADTLILNSLKPLSAVVAGTTLNLPPGYRKALKYALACELAPEYGKAVDPKLEDIALKAKTAIQRTNIEPQFMQSDAFGLSECRGYDIYSGGPPE